MKFSVSGIVFFLLASVLSGCITSYSPNTGTVTMKAGESQVFSIKSSVKNQVFEWYYDSNLLNHTGGSYTYSPSAAETGEHQIKAVSGKDSHTWVVRVASGQVITWEKSYDVGSEGTNDSSCSVFQTDNGGYVVAGISGSRLCILRLDSAGVVQWEKWLDNFNDFNPVKGHLITIAQAQDGGFVIVLTQSIKVGEDVENKIIAIKLDSQGNAEWSQYYINDVESELISFKKVTDGGYLLYALNKSVGYVLIKLDKNFMISWEKNMETYDFPTEAIETDDGGFNVVFTEYDGIKLKKYDSSGNFVWEKDNKYCTSFCTDMIIPADHGEFLINSGMLTTKFDQTGETQWEFKGITNPPNRWNWLNTIKHTNDGGYIVGGSSRPKAIEGFVCLPMDVCIAGVCRWTILCGTYPIKEFASDAWVIKLDSAGDLKWNRYFGNTNEDHCIASIEQTSDGGFIAAGRKKSRDNSINMLYVIKLDMQGNLN
jgi:hypothetical protein